MSSTHISHSHVNIHVTPIYPSWKGDFLRRLGPQSFTIAHFKELQLLYHTYSILHNIFKSYLLFMIHSTFLILSCQICSMWKEVNGTILFHQVYTSGFFLFLQPSLSYPGFNHGDGAAFRPVARDLDRCDGMCCTPPGLPVQERPALFPSPGES